MGNEDKDKWKSYRKKSVVIQAFQTRKKMPISAIGGTVWAEPGDFVIRGIKGELYPCRGDIFEETYEEVKNDGS